MYKVGIDFESVLRMFSRVYFLFLFLFAFSLRSYAEIPAFERAKISYIRWDIETRQRLTPDEVRERAYIVIEILDRHEVSAFVDWLALDKMKISLQPAVADARLVIDLFGKDGVRTAFYAGYFGLVSADGLKFREIDSKFRLKFPFFENGDGREMSAER